MYIRLSSDGSYYKENHLLISLRSRNNIITVVVDTLLVLDNAIN